MMIAVARVRLFAPWVHSLKEKRMVVKSLTSRVHNRFSVSIAEVEDQDLHQSIVLGVACVAGGRAQADSILDHVIDFIERNTEAEITDIQREIR